MIHYRCLSSFLLAGCLGLLPQSARAAEQSLNGHRFTLPDGFRIEQVAAAPMVLRPITAALDEEGNLYVADSSGSNEAVEKQLEDKPHRILRLEDRDRNGHYETRRVFAKDMMFPEGTLWKDGSLYVSAPPSIWRLTDTNGDGWADQRQEWYQGKTLTGCANDLHGPYAGRDGWIYWCKGAFAEQTHPRPGRHPLVTRAAHIFRARPDGSGIEPVMTGGMDNPVDVVFTPGGERIFTTTFLQHPAQGLRDGLIHAVYGGVYGKPHDVIDNHPRTGEVMPVLTHLGPAAPCGLALYDTDTFGTNFQNNLFACLFNLHKVTRHVLVPNGPTFTTRDSDFLVSDQMDFHPTDVVVDADGSLLVVDTGGWYKICCPTSQLYKPDVLGAIYRIVREDARPVGDPRGTRLRWNEAGHAELVSWLEDPRWAVRERAINTLATRGAESVPALEAALVTSTNALLRRNAVWALSRIPGVAARSANRTALGDPVTQVRQAATHAAGLWRDADARDPLEALLAGDSVAVERAAAEALGRLGLAASVPPLLQSIDQLGEQTLSGNAQRVLEHSLVYALIEIGDADSVRPELARSEARIQAAALIALDQMDRGGLEAETVTPHLVSTNALLQQTATWIVNHHPGWAPALATFFRGQLSGRALGPDQQAELARQLTRFAEDPAIQDLLGEFAANNMAESGGRRTALRAMALSHPKVLPDSWVMALQTVFASLDFQLLSEAVATARALPPVKHPSDEFIFALRRVAGDPTIPPQTRLDAMMARPEGIEQVPADLFEFLQSSLASDQPVRNRLDAATILATAPLDETQLDAVIRWIPKIGPMELTTLLPAFDRSTNAMLGLKLIAALNESPFRDALRADQIQPHLKHFPASVKEAALPLFAAMEKDLATMQTELETLLKSLPVGDVRNGQAVFNSTKAACSSCHAIGYLGGDSGPDLTRIGPIRALRDLLEAIIFPSASFVRSYEPVIVTTKDENVLTGILRRDDTTTIELVTGPDAKVQIHRDSIVEIQPGTVSIMPAGLDEILTRQELADLLAFLKATNWR